MITRAKLRTDPNQQLHTPLPTVTPGRKERKKNLSWTKTGKFKLPPEDGYLINDEIEKEKNNSKYLDPNATDTDESEAYGWYKEEEKAQKAEAFEKENVLDNSLFPHKQVDDNSSFLQLSITSFTSNPNSVIEQKSSIAYQDNGEEESKESQYLEEHNSITDMSLATYDEEADTPNKHNISLKSKNEEQKSHDDHQDDHNTANQEKKVLENTFTTYLLIYFY